MRETDSTTSFHPTIDCHKGVRIIYKHQIELVTFSDIKEFISVTTGVKGDVKLIDGNGFCVNGKSLLGAAATVEWDTLYCVSDEDIYTSIRKFCKE